MDVARGGRFETVPPRYPENAVYSYDDESCDYACQVTEFTYWAVSSLAGSRECQEGPMKSRTSGN
ncbi:MAG: hypothetical protein CM15mP115_23080 [Alphaproteobacteria bacterium]|nr:MAG: hypothetical protein CM15mP115_23080 [Alphaproteobacteria bacterium]